MSFPPEDRMRAALAVLQRAILAARMLGYEGSFHGLSTEKSAQLADLMDAVHNIPYLLTTWERCDESLLVSMLKTYDEKWGAALANEYARVLASSQRRDDAK